MLRKHLLSGEKIENTMKRMAFLVVGLLVTAITVTVFIISAPPSFDIAEVLGEEGVFDKLDNGLYIAVLKEENVNDNFFDGLCVAILRNVTDTELVSLIGAGLERPRVRYFRYDENITKIRGFIMDPHCSTSIVVP